ncbi:MAG: hypothetical protein H6725_07015 [Sandaracinaceae bacterium]|nr:hypothetical protein [Sandaracinaceae bacterium]
MISILAATVLSACEPVPNSGPPVFDGGPPVECARAATGCLCEPGEGPVRCTPRSTGDGATCLVGDMYCRGGVWSACESLQPLDTSRRRSGGATAALVGQPSACDPCSPDCAEVVDAPNCTEITATNATGDTICAPGGGFTIPPGPVPAVVPSCTESMMGLPPGGSYADFCAADGSLILLAADASGNTDPSTEVCADQLAADTFTQALCSCKNIDSAYSLTTDAFNSLNGTSGANTAHVFTNEHWRPGGRAQIGGDVLAFGSGTHSPGGQNHIQGRATFNGPLSTIRAFNAGLATGDLFVNGNIAFGAAVSVGGRVHQPSGSTMTGGSGLTRVLEPVSVQAPCDCGAANVIDINGFVAAFRTANDNSVIGLGPNDWASGASGSLTLPCGRFYLSQVNTGASFTITATGRTALLIDGDLRTGAQLTIGLSGPAAEVDVFVAGTVDAGASVTLGDPSRPASVRLYVGGSQPIDFSGHGSFGGNFYAPNADVNFGGTIDVYGSLYVGKAIGTSNLRIHYDEGVLTPDCPPPATGTYTRVYDYSQYCGVDIESRPDWGDFTWDADVPEGSELYFEFRTAETAAGLATAQRVRLPVPPNTPVVNVGDMLIAAGLQNFLPFLSVTAHLSGNGTVAPVVRSFSTQFECGFGSSGVSDPGAFSCGGSPLTCNQVCGAEQCTGGTDDDCDGQVDCADSDCATDPACSHGEICGNFLDDDGDGLEDFWDTADCPCAAEACNDGLDNDADTLVDCADTAACANGASCNAWGSVCSGGACVCPGGATSETNCSDGFDNDCDGFADCGDGDCLTSPQCLCGNGAIDAVSGEQCDDGGVETATCDLDCTNAFCGDGQRNMTAGEACDTAGNSATCDANCTTAVCGDSYVNPAAGETCDSGVGETATCNADCTTASCGDGKLNRAAGEQCDQGAAMPTATCIACIIAGCGNGVTEPFLGETCDTSGESATCDGDCTQVVCGDGRVNAAAGEQCDTSGPTPGCSATCQVIALPTLVFEGVFDTTTGLLNGVAVAGWSAATHRLTWGGHVSVRAGMTLTVTGAYPLDVTAAGNISVVGTILARGGDGPTITVPLSLRALGGVAGPGGGDGGRGADEYFVSQSGSNATGATTGRGGGGGDQNNQAGSGGGGGGYSSAGTAGTAATGSSGGTAGASYSGFFGGAGGGGGGADVNGGGGVTDHAGGSGGGGGGAVRLTASGTLTVSGTIDVRGGNGGGAVSGGGGGGGGSGGAIALTGGTAPAVTGSLLVSGGNGGSPRGGAGAAGRITLAP